MRKLRSWEGGSFTRTTQLICRNRGDLHIHGPVLYSSTSGSQDREVRCSHSSLLLFSQWSASGLLFFFSYRESQVYIPILPMGFHDFLLSFKYTSPAYSNKVKRHRRAIVRKGDSNVCVSSAECKGPNRISIGVNLNRRCTLLILTLLEIKLQVHFIHVLSMKTHVFKTWFSHKIRWETTAGCLNIQKHLILLR